MTLMNFGRVAQSLQTQLAIGLTLLAAAGCSLSGTQADPFATYTDQFGRNLVSEPNTTITGPGGTSAATTFRQDLTLTLANNDPNFDVSTLMVAWVLPNSFTNADQQDQLLTAGYVQLTSPATIGTVFNLPVGTFVWNGPGYAGGTPFTISHGTASADGSTVAPKTQSLTLPSPDALLIYLAPPTSCESPAFVFTQGGSTANIFFFSGGYDAPGQANTFGPTKTLAQVDAYQCGDGTHDFQPGLFLRRGGGARDVNQYLEGDNIRFDFYRFSANNTEVAAHVTIGG